MSCAGSSWASPGRRTSGAALALSHPPYDGAMGEAPPLSPLSSMGGASSFVMHTALQEGDDEVEGDEEQVRGVSREGEHCIWGVGSWPAAEP